MNVNKHGLVVIFDVILILSIITILHVRKCLPWWPGNQFFWREKERAALLALQKKKKKKI